MMAVHTSLSRISVVICTRNPHRGRFGRVLDALARQTLDPAHWELIVVDNGSEPPVAGSMEEEPPCRVRHVVEPRVGTIHARLKGIECAAGELIVFVDDDNVLEPDYLLAAWEVAKRHPRLGVWGGSCIGEFEQEPETWVRPFLNYLAIREVEADFWSSIPDSGKAPFGAGLCMRSFLAREYREWVRQDSESHLLGRQGDGMASGDDTDMVYFVLGHGYGMGLFPALRLAHLIPAGRLKVDYLERLLEGIARSELLVNRRHGIKSKVTRDGLLVRLAWLLSMRNLDPRIRRLEAATARGARG